MIPVPPGLLRPQLPRRRAAAASGPALPDAADWHTYEAARQKLMPNLSRKNPAERYRACAAA
jgi:hypothetical protein